MAGNFIWIVMMAILPMGTDATLTVRSRADGRVLAAITLIKVVATIYYPLKPSS